MIDKRALPTTTSGQSALTVADDIVRKAGALVAEASPQARSMISTKGRRSWVTETDGASETLILDHLSKAFPTHAVLSEESQPETDWTRDYVWIVDPLDGTRNFAAGIPLFCVTIALALDGQVVLGATYDPNRDMSILGGPGLGVSVNGDPVAASSASELHDAIITADLGHDDVPGTLMLELVHKLWPEVQGIRIVGSAGLGLAWAAAGLTDIMIHSSLKPWDVAAALALVPGAGGSILDRSGGAATLASEGVVAGAPNIVKEIVERTRGRPWH